MFTCHSLIWPSSLLPTDLPLEPASVFVGRHALELANLCGRSVQIDVDARVIIISTVARCFLIALALILDRETLNRQYLLLIAKY